VGKMMQRVADIAPAAMTIAEFRRRFPLGSTPNVVLTDATGTYFGIVDTSRLFEATLDSDQEVGALASMKDVVLNPAENVRHAMAVFDSNGADFLAVVSDEREVVGTLSERFVQRRYADELEKAQREMFGE
jgi:CIC family chloride channel protein